MHNEPYEDNVKILALSTLMINSALKIKKLRVKLNEQGNDAKIVVGGAPFRFDNNLWREVGADAMAHTATEGVPVLKSIMEGLSND